MVVTPSSSFVSLVSEKEREREQTQFGSEVFPSPFGHSQAGMPQVQHGCWPWEASPQGSTEPIHQQLSFDWLCMGVQSLA